MSTLSGKAQRCEVCGQEFSGPTSGDAHRVIAETYDIVRVGGKLVHTQPVRDAKGRPVVQKGERLVSTGNQIRRCLTAEEMAAKGMERDKRGRWRLAGAGEWWGSEEVPA